MVQRIGVVGAGVMGAGIAQMFAEQAKTVVLWDVDEDQLGRGLAAIERRLQRSVEKGSKPPSIIGEVLGRIARATGLAECGEAELVIEAVTENIRVKQQVLSELSGRIAEAAILASNTYTRSSKTDWI